MNLYKQIREKLNKKFNNPYSSHDGYDVRGAVYHWLAQSNIEPTSEAMYMLHVANGKRTVYPYQKADRKRIRKYLKENKKWNP